MMSFRRSGGGKEEGGGRMGMRPGHGRHLEGRKCGILKFGRFWRIGVCIAEGIRREFALRN